MLVVPKHLSGGDINFVGVMLSGPSPLSTPERGPPHLLLKKIYCDLSEKVNKRGHYFFILELSVCLPNQEREPGESTTVDAHILFNFSSVKRSLNV